MYNIYVNFWFYYAGYRQKNKSGGDILAIEDGQTGAKSIWTKTFVLILVVSFSLRISTQMQNTLLPMYVLESGGGALAAGLVVTFYSVSALASRPLSGRLSDQKGRYPVLLIGAAVFALAAGLYILPLPMAAVLALRALCGFGFSWNNTAISTMASDVLPSKRMSEGMGYIGLTNTVAQMFAPSAVLAAKDSSGFAGGFILIFSVSLLALVICVPLRTHSRGKSGGEAAALPIEEPSSGESSYAKDSGNKDSKLLHRIFERHAWKPSILMLFVMLACSSVFAFLPTLAESRGIEGVGVFFTVSAVATIVCRLIASGVSRRFGPAAVVLPGFIFLGASFVGIATCGSFTGLLVCAVCYGFGLGSIQPEVNAVAVLKTPAEHRGAANATFNMMMDIGYGIGGLLWGLVASGAGIAAVFVLGAGLVLFTTVLYIVMWRRRLI
jgi:MFS family permease